MTSWTKNLTRWQRFRRRFALMGGSYTHPDGTIELDFEAPAGIEPTDSDEVRKQKLAWYERHRAAKAWEWSRVGGIGWVAVGVYLLAKHTDLSFWDTAAVIGFFALGLWHLSSHR